MGEAKRNIFITGGSAGIGRATAIAFAERGANVGILGRKPGKLSAVREAMEATGGGGSYLTFEADVSDARSVESVFSALGESWTRIDNLFVNAGINGVWAPIEEIEPEEWARTISINLNGAYHTVKYSLPFMKSRGGAIVFDASGCGVRAFTYKGMSAYGSTKAALVGLTKILAVELAQYKIRVNAVRPGPTSTDIFNEQVTRNTDAIASWVSYPWVDFERGQLPVPLAEGALVSPEQVAESVVYLCSDASSMVTGTCIDIDGGASLIQ